MGFKQKGFPMHKTASALKQSTSTLGWLKDRWDEYTGRQTYEEWMAENHPDVNLKTEHDPIPEGMTGTRDLAAKMEEVNRLRRENAEKKTEGGKVLPRKLTYVEAWKNMTAADRAKHGSFEAFEKAAIEYNASNE